MPETKKPSIHSNRRQFLRGAGGGAFDLLNADACRVWERPFDSNHSWEIIEQMDDVTVARPWRA